MEPPEEAAEGETTDEAAEDEDASQDSPDHDIPSRTRYAGSFYSPELNTTYRIVEEGGAGLSLHVGRLDPAALLAESDGVLTSERGMTFRGWSMRSFSEPSVLPHSVPFASQPLG